MTITVIVFVTAISPIQNTPTAWRLISILVLIHCGGKTRIAPSTGRRSARHHGKWHPLPRTRRGKGVSKIRIPLGTHLYAVLGRPSFRENMVKFPVGSAHQA